MAHFPDHCSVKDKVARTKQLIHTFICCMMCKVKKEGGGWGVGSAACVACLKQHLVFQHIRRVFEVSNLDRTAEDMLDVFQCTEASN